MDLGLAQRVYLVTGGSKGLGFATARALVADGARVVLSSRSEEHVAAAVAELGEGATGVVGDNTDPDLPEKLLATAKERFGRVDGMLVSVGGPPSGTVLGTSLDAWQDAFDAIFVGTLRLLRAVAAELSEGGALALVLSTSVREPLANLAVSNGLRPGLAMTAKALAGELGPRGIRVVSLLPGGFATDRMLQLVGGDTGALHRRVQGVPLGRLGEPDEFGRVAAFVLSPAASYLTGTVVSIDGGVVHGL